MKLSRRRTFAVAVVAALFVVPVASTFAYFLASGSGTVSGAQITSTSPATVAITPTYSDSNEFSYAPAGATALSPGGTVSMPLYATCTAACPASVSSIRLASVTSDKAGCNSASLPGSFTGGPLVVNQTITTTPTPIGNFVAAFNSDPDRDQSVCLGATLTFNLTTP
jgi:hypothetical protein